MAVPTLTAVTPGEGHTGGRTVVELTGTGFKLPNPPAPTGKTTAPPPSMRVLFGGRPAMNIAVTSATQLYCQTPIHDPGLVDVVVQNIDDDGVLVPTEEATLVDAYTFARPDLSAHSELARALEAFIIEMRRQVSDNVDWAVHTDYASDTQTIAYMGKLPAIVLDDLDLPEDRSTSEDSYDVQIDDETFVERRAPIVVNALFTIMGMANDPPTLLTLIQVVRAFFKKNPKLTYDRDANDPTLGEVSYNMGADIDGRVVVAKQKDNTNLLFFTGSVRIESIWLEDMPGITTAGVPGVPSWLPHEATTRYGWISETIVPPTAQRKP